MTTTVKRTTTVKKRPLPVPVDPAPQKPSPRTVVMVVSPGAETTRADVAFNLATVSAEVGQRVAVVSTSIRETSVPIRNGSLDDGDGAATASNPQVDVRALLEDTSVPRVSLLNLEDLFGQPTQVVNRLPEMLETLRHLVDVVILDVPSFLTVHHGQALAPFADVVLVVGERRFTTLYELRRTNAMLRRLGAPVVGMALTNQTVRDEWQEEDEAWTSTPKPPAIELGPKEAEDAGAPSDPVDAVDAVDAVDPSDAVDAVDADDEGAASPPHRRRRAIVDHLTLASGPRSDQPDGNAPTPEA